LLPWSQILAYKQQGPLLKYTAKKVYLFALEVFCFACKICIMKEIEIDSDSDIKAT
jgi:hypothetical protein